MQPINLKAILQTMAAAIAGLWGGIPALAQLLVILMIFDILFGLSDAIYNKTGLSADKAWRGATKKVGALLLVGMASIIQQYVHLDLGVDLVQTVSAFYLVGEIVSITKHAVQIDVLVPPQFSTIANYFEGVGGNKKEGENETPVSKDSG